MMKKILGFLAGIALLLYGCNKEEGPGGFSKITGTIMVKEVNKNNWVLKTYPYAGEDVYIVYGNKDYFDDDTETSYDGYFEFTNLTTGDYTIWFYSDDTSAYSGNNKTFISYKVSLGKKETYSFDTLIAYDVRNIEDGNSSISGTIYEVNYRFKSSLPYDTSDIMSILPTQETDVYIVYEDDDFYFERTRTHYDGTFKFENLIKGKYRIYIYSDNIPGGMYNAGSDNIFYNTPPTNHTIYREVTIDSDFQEQILDDMYIENVLEIEDGTSSVSGKVYLIKYWITAYPPYDTNDIQDITPAEETDVYIIYNNDPVFFERTRTNYNGMFKFSNLINGNYRVYVYSEDIPGGIYNSGSENVIFDTTSLGTYNLVIYRDVYISEDYQDETVSDMYIEKN